MKREALVKMPVSGPPLKKLKNFGALLPFALLWYLGRFFRKALFSLFYRTFGRFGFRSIGRRVIFDGWVQFIWPCADIRLGHQVRIGRRCVFQGAPDVLIQIEDRVTVNDGAYITGMFGITIGSGTSIGEYVSIRDYDHGFRDPDLQIKAQGYVGGPIHIGKDCWIGRGVFIKGNVIIGDGAVIGANSVVTRDVAPFSIVVGSPAQPIGSRRREVK